MLREIKRLIIFGLLISFSFCSSPIKKNDCNSYSEIEKANWLIGYWQNVSSEGIATEIWKKDNDSVFSGTSFLMHEKDTVFIETFVLIQKGSDVLFIPTVKNQNGGDAVQFTLTDLKENQLVFENPTHDFPQKISYSLITNDSILAKISGLQDGKQKTIQFPFNRIN